MVYTIELLCANRHRVFVTAYDDEFIPELEAKARLELLRIERGIALCCSKCGSRDMDYQVKSSSFGTAIEALDSIAHQASG